MKSLSRYLVSSSELLMFSNRMDVKTVGCFPLHLQLNYVVAMIPGSIFHPNDMRPHLFKCLNTGTLERFPQNSPQAVKTVCIHCCKPENITRELYCICRMPDHYDKRMVQCTLCQRWYHYCCMEIRNKKDIPVNWRCSTCLKCLA